MHYDATTLQRLRARDAHDEQQHQARLEEIRAEDKPLCSTVMTITEARLLVQAHHYDEGEQIGVAKTGDDRGMGHQALVHENGHVVLQAGWVPVMKGCLSKQRRNSGRAWTAQSAKNQRS
jgi:hypothetical protein